MHTAGVHCAPIDQIVQCSSVCFDEAWGNVKRGGEGDSHPLMRARERACAHALTHYRLPHHTHNHQHTSSHSPLRLQSSIHNRSVDKRGVGGGCLFNGRAEQAAQQCALHTGVALYNGGHSVRWGSPFSRQRSRPASSIHPSPRWVLPFMSSFPNIWSLPFITSPHPTL